MIFAESALPSAAPAHMAGRVRGSHRPEWRQAPCGQDGCLREEASDQGPKAQVT